MLISIRSAPWSEVCKSLTEQGKLLVKIKMERKEKGKRSLEMLIDNA